MGDRYRFARFDLDVHERRFRRDKAEIRIEPKSFDVLVYLLERAGTLVSKQELVDAVWRNVNVSDSSLARCVHQIRAALQDDADSPEFIETVPRSGYRFIAPVTHDGDVDAPSFPQAGHRTPLQLTAAVALLAVALAGLWMTYTSLLGTDHTVSRLAVLPLENLTGDPAQQYFVHGIHEAVIAELSRIDEIDVISRTSVARYEGTDMAIPDIAQQMSTRSSKDRCQGEATI